jgi:putative ABC transport system permease protein
MNPFILVLAILRRHRLITWLFVAIVALSVALGVGVLNQEKALRQGSTTAADKFDLIIGAPGSHTDLLLSAVYLQPKAVELIDGKILQDIATNPDVKFVAPLAFGDNHQGEPVVGSTPEFVAYLSDGKLEGRLFERVTEAVAGVDASLGIGDRFSPSHGHGEISEEAAEAADHAELEIEIVGRLPRTGTPWDSAIVSSVESVWAIHDLPLGHDPKGARAEAVGAPFDAAFLPGIPAAIVKPSSFGAAYSLRGQYRTAATTAFFPAEVLLQLYSLMGDVRLIMSLLTLATQVLVLLGILAGILALMQLFRQQFLVLRAMGAPRLYLLAVMWGYSAALVLIGSVIGLGLGWGISTGLASWLTEKTGIALRAGLGLSELRSALQVVLAGWFLALVPAVLLYRQPALEQHHR